MITYFGTDLLALLAFLPKMQRPTKVWIKHSRKVCFTQRNPKQVLVLFLFGNLASHIKFNTFIGPGIRMTV